METPMQSQKNQQFKSSPSDIKIHEEFHFGSLKFANNPLHQKLKARGEIKEKLQFIPRMLFFVLGFKDLMQLVRYDQPKNELEKIVNTHSDEDSFHWGWYLKDLQFMDPQFKNANSVDVISQVWDDDTMEVRRTVYGIAKIIQELEDPAARMLVIEVLEDAFEKFKDAIHPVLKEADLYNQFDYFGKAHQETEENHSANFGDDTVEGLIKRLPEALKERMILVINSVFDKMYKMASNWAEAIP